MSGIALQASVGGSAAVTIAAPEVNSPVTYELPKQAGKLSAFGAPAAKTATGTAVDFINGVGDVVIPDDARRVTVMLNGVSTNGTSNVLLQLGSGTIQTSGYLGSSSVVTSAVSSQNNSAGFRVDNFASAANVRHGKLELCRVSVNTWAFSGVVSTSDLAGTSMSAGTVTLTGPLDRIRMTTVNGTDQYDGGTFSILVE